MRGKCEFKYCLCTKFIKNNNNRCITCKHGRCWHNKIKKTDRSQFLSSRPTVRKQTYQYNLTIFTPQPQNINHIVIQNNYCKSVDELPA